MIQRMCVSHHSGFGFNEPIVLLKSIKLTQPKLQCCFRQMSAGVCRVLFFFFFFFFFAYVSVSIQGLNFMSDSVINLKKKFKLISCFNF